MAGAEEEERSHGFDSFPLKLPSFIPNLFPFLKPKPTNDANSSKLTGASGDGNSQKSTYETVSFPKIPSKNTEPLKLEAEGSSGSTSNSLVLWQVYALGGFLVLKWAWARWNERNEKIDKKKMTDDGDDQPSLVDEDNDQPSLVDENNDQPSLVDEDNDQPSLVDEDNDQPSLVDEDNDQSSDGHGD